MKRLKLQRPLLTLVTATLLTCAADALAANCTFDGSPSTQTLSFGASLANGGLSIPADTPDGTVVYQDTAQQSSWHYWRCTATSQYGVAVNPAFGTPASYVTTFPLGKTGLSFRIWMDMLDRYEPSLFAISPKGYGIASGSVRLEIIKSGPLAANVTVAAGSLGTLQSGELILNRFNLANSLVVNTASCQTPSVPVAMGDDYQLNEFREAGAHARTVRFNIGLNQCQTGIKKVTYSLKANTPVIDAAKGIVALNDSSTAKGIGLQLMNDVGQPMALNTTYPFNAFTTTGTSFKIPLTAAYYRLGKEEPQAGSANTEVTFIVNYL
ncbi:fimbrial protein [Pseudomonas sp. B2M1-30]|uniref:fimbrial protein n=1 Tax=Pseudomonas TaxID=286 RepID=UPI0021C8A184|nr:MULTISPECIES: fimbrial protein [Pseudomonas]MCU0121145.1 fimbrial protein [Pseudomonas sp. B2M1-30]MCU7262774.1 fimbrial protein [Pseudomonas koreensis]